LDNTIYIRQLALDGRIGDARQGLLITQKIKELEEFFRRGAIEVKTKNYYF